MLPSFLPSFVYVLPSNPPMFLVNNRHGSLRHNHHFNRQCVLLRNQYDVRQNVRPPNLPRNHHVSRAVVLRPTLPASLRGNQQCDPPMPPDPAHSRPCNRADNPRDAHLGYVMMVMHMCFD